jgi:cobalt-zinc-cadmium efflux system outer membrane protein
MNNILNLLLLFLISNAVCAQIELDSLLKAVHHNSKVIQAHNQLMKAKKTFYKTGLSLSNPTLEYDYMRGSPATAGNQTDISAIQSFDFPTAYYRKKQLSNLSIEKLIVISRDRAQEIMFVTKQKYIELVYLNKHKSILAERQHNALLTSQAIKLKFESGVATILDLNKSKVNLIAAESHLQQVGRKINEANQKLTELNGGKEVTVTSVSYPLTELKPLDSIMTEASTGDYHLQVIEYDIRINEKQAQVNKSLALPKLEGGYRYQTILGQSFKGFHAGISIPLFENKNKTKAVLQQVKYYNLLMESHKNEHHNELELFHQKATSIQNSVGQYKELFSSLNSRKLLNTALENGEISSIEYFMELSYFNDANDELMLLEKELCLVLSQLYKYQL